MNIQFYRIKYYFSEKKKNNRVSKDRLIPSVDILPTIRHVWYIFNPNDFSIPVNYLFNKKYEWKKKEGLKKKNT